MKTCFMCKNADVDPGHPGSFDPRVGGEPPEPAFAECTVDPDEELQSDDMAFGDADCSNCPKFQERVESCVVCGKKVLISEVVETLYGGLCCSVSCADREDESWD